jgi:hypothetical protein
MCAVALVVSYFSGCVAVIDSPTPIPGFDVYGRIEPNLPLVSSEISLKLVALPDEHCPGVVLRLAEPENFSTPLEQAFTEVVVSVEEQPLLSVPPSSHATQRFHIWAGETVPMGPKLGKGNADHVILLWQPNSNHVYRISVATQHAEVYQLDVNHVREALSEARNARTEKGFPPERWPFSTSLENKRFWKRIPWTPTDAIGVSVHQEEGGAYRLELLFPNAWANEIVQEICGRKVARG